MQQVQMTKKNHRISILMSLKIFCMKKKLQIQRSSLLSMIAFRNSKRRAEAIKIYQFWKK